MPMAPGGWQPRRCGAAPQAIIDKAEAWLAKVAEAAAGKAPLKKLRELLHGGLRLGTDVPQVIISFAAPPLRTDCFRDGNLVRVAWVLSQFSANPTVR